MIIHSFSRLWPWILAPGLVVVPGELLVFFLSYRLDQKLQVAKLDFASNQKRKKSFDLASAGLVLLFLGSLIVAPISESGVAVIALSYLSFAISAAGYFGLRRLMRDHDRRI